MEWRAVEMASSVDRVEGPGWDVVCDVVVACESLNHLPRIFGVVVFSADVCFAFLMSACSYFSLMQSSTTRP